MSKDNKYNGWTNRETWTVNLWLSNEQSSQEYWQEQARSAYAEALEDVACGDEATALQDAVYSLSDSLRDDIEEMADSANAGMLLDLLNSAIEKVNFDEIAGNILDGVLESA